MSERETARKEPVDPTGLALKAERDRCIMCGTCTTVCPLSSALGSEDYLGPGQFSQYVPRPAHHLSRFKGLPYLCTECLRCVQVCPGAIKTPQLTRELRSRLAAQGLAPDTVMSLAENVASSGNIYGMAADDRLIWSMMVDDLVASRVGSPGDVVYYLGCQTSYSGPLASIAESMVYLMDRVGECFSLLGTDEWCCGQPLRMLGLNEHADNAIERNMEALERSGARCVVCSCPSCFHALRDRLPRKIEVLHHTQYLARLVEEERVPSKNVFACVAYHDPCELARGAGIVDEPRKVLRSISHELVEPADHALGTACCGSGGVLRVTRSEAFNKVLSERIGSLLGTEAPTMVTACPSCLAALRHGLEDAGSEGDALDIAQALARSLKDDGSDSERR